MAVRRFNTRGFLLGMVVVAGVLNTYLMLGSAAYNPDGLRVFPGLHKVFAVTGADPAYLVQHHFTGYQSEYLFRGNVQMHFLFPLYAHVSYDLARQLGQRGSGLRVMQVANAVSAAIALALFVALLASAFESAWTIVAATAGLAFSAAFSAMATNIAEVVPAMPWLLLGLTAVYYIRGRDESQAALEDKGRGTGDGRTRRSSVYGLRSLAMAVLAGVCLGVSTAFYLAGAVIGFALAFMLRRRPVQAVVMLGAMLISVGLIYTVVLYGAGYHSLAAIRHAATFLPWQGTYGGFKITNLVAVVFGFANSLFPVLPESFAGLRQLWAALQSTGRASYLSLAAIPLIVGVSIVFLATLLRERTRLTARSRSGLLLGVAVFVGTLAASLFWDPYHPKLWMYSNIGLWLAIAAALDYYFRTRDHRRIIAIPLSALVILTAVATNLSVMIQRHEPNPRWMAATELARRVADHAHWDGSNRLVMGGWEPDFDYLTLLLWDTSMISLPDAYFLNGRDTRRFRSEVEGRITDVLSRGGNVYFMNLFNRTPEELQRSYVDRLHFPDFASWLDGFRPRVKLAWHDARTGNDLYELADTILADPGP